MINETTLLTTFEFNNLIDEETCMNCEMLSKGVFLYCYCKKSHSIIICNDCYYFCHKDLGHKALPISNSSIVTKCQCKFTSFSDKIPKPYGFSRSDISCFYQEFYNIFENKGVLLKNSQYLCRVCTENVGICRTGIEAPEIEYGIAVEYSTKTICKCSFHQPNDIKNFKDELLKLINLMY